MSDDEKNRVVVEQPLQYGTFQGVANYPPSPQSQPSIWFPQPVPPPRISAPPFHYHGYAVGEGRTVRERCLPCCGIGCGWFLFIFGFFLATIPWYVGLIILLCGRKDYREKPGYIACTIAAILSAVAFVLVETKNYYLW